MFKPPAVLVLASVVVIAHSCGYAGSPTGKRADAAEDGGGIVAEPDTGMPADMEAGKDGGDSALDAGGEPVKCPPDFMESFGEPDDVSLGLRASRVFADACEVHAFRFAAGRGMKIRAAASSFDPDKFPTRLKLYGTDFITTRAGAPLGEGEGLLEASLYYSGEHLLLVSTGEDAGKGQYDLSIDCIENCDVKYTRFPIVLVHGWMGFKNISFVEYFYGVEEDLKGRGYDVFVPQLSAFNRISVRGGQLAGHLDEILGQTRSRKVNIIAHSQGGLDSRYAISTLGYGDRVGVLAMVSTPNKGTSIADVAVGILPGPAEALFGFFLDLLGVALGEDDQNARDSLHDISKKNVTESFNPANPDDPRVFYWSWAGKTCLDGSCGDICDVEVQVGYLILKEMEGYNDGVVSVDSARYGFYYDTIPADHFDEVGQVAGITNENFDHKRFYSEIAARIARAGY